MLKLAYNTTDSAVVDELGYSVGGRSWGAVDSTDPQTKTDFEAGRLIDVPEDAARNATHPEVLDAVRSLDERRSRLEAAKALDKAELLEVADPDVVATLDVGADGTPSKADLVEAVAGDPDAELDEAPVPAPKKSTSRAAAKK